MSLTFPQRECLEEGRGLPPLCPLSGLACGGRWDQPLLLQGLWISLHQLIRSIWLLPRRVLIASMHSLTPLSLAEDTLIKTEGPRRGKKAALFSPPSFVHFLPLKERPCAHRHDPRGETPAKDSNSCKCSLLSCVHWQSHEHNVDGGTVHLDFGLSL